MPHKDQNDNSSSTPYVYVPRKSALKRGGRHVRMWTDADLIVVSAKFEGSLGKVQFLSANCPRTLIDLSSRAATPPPINGVRKSSDPSVDVQAASSLRKYKLLLMQVENLWNVLLEAEDRSRQLSVAPDNLKYVLSTPSSPITHSSP